MSNDKQKEPREQLEVRITALALGEASAFETAELEREIENDAQLQEFYREIRQTIGLVHELEKKEKPDAVDSQPRLSDRRRKKLVNLFKTPTKKPVELTETPEKKNWSRNIIAIAAVLVVCAIVASALIPSARKKEFQLSMLEESSFDESNFDESDSRGFAETLSAAPPETPPQRPALNTPTRAISSRGERLAETGESKTAIFLPGQQAEERESQRGSQLVLDTSGRTYFAESSQPEQAARQTSSQTELNRSLGRSVSVNGSQQEQWFFDNGMESAPPPQLQQRFDDRTTWGANTEPMVSTGSMEMSRGETAAPSSPPNLGDVPALGVAFRNESGSAGEQSSGRFGDVVISSAGPAGSRTYIPSGEIANDAIVSYDPASNTITVRGDETFAYIEPLDRDSSRNKNVQTIDLGSADGPETVRQLQELFGSDSGNGRETTALASASEFAATGGVSSYRGLNGPTTEEFAEAPTVGFEIAANESNAQGRRGGGRGDFGGGFAGPGRGGRGGRGGVPASGPEQQSGQGGGQQQEPGQPVRSAQQIVQNAQGGQGQQAPLGSTSSISFGISDDLGTKVAGVVVRREISPPVDAEEVQLQSGFRGGFVGGGIAPSEGFAGGGGGFGGGGGGTTDGFNLDAVMVRENDSGMLGLPASAPVPAEPRMDGRFTGELRDFDADGAMDLFERNASSQTRGFSASNIIDESIPASVANQSYFQNRQRSDEALAKSVAAVNVQDARVLLDLGKLEEAEDELRSALVADPGNAQAQRYLEITRESQYARQMSALSAQAKDRLLEIEEARKVPSAATSSLSGNQFTGEVKLRIPKASADMDTSVSSSRRAELQEESDSYYAGMAIETITSDAVLSETVRRLDLVDKWNASDFEAAKAALKGRLEVTPDPGRDDIKIGVRSESPEEAAELAGTVAAVYRDAKISEMRERGLRSVELLRGQLQEQEARIEETARQLRETTRQNGSPNLDANYESAVRDFEQQTRLRDALEAKISQELEDINNASRLQSFAPEISPVSVDVSAESALPEQETVPATPAATLEPQPEVITAQEPFSTFSLNVSDVSFKLAASSLEAGTMPDGSQLRSEEFINAFDYHDPAPSPGERIGFTWDRATYPFAQNRDLIRFSIATAAQGREEGVPLNLVLLLDNSGSMERSDRVQIINEALGVLAGQLNSQDRISVVTFASSPRLVVDGLSGGQSDVLLNRVVGLTPQGGTNLETALELAYETASRHYQESGNNRVILLTDGAANLGNVDPETLKEEVVTQRKKGIAFDCFGIGWEGYNDTLLETLSRNGDGRYGFINSPEEAGADFADQLAGALQVAAADVKAQVEFNPERVISYRQIGYIKHQLTKEQFRDNTVDAAEIGAAESGNALYVIQVNPNGRGPIGTARARYRVPSTGAYEEKEWTLDYNRNVMPLDQSNPAMRLAATSGAFAEWLAQSPYAGEVSPTILESYLRGVPEAFAPDSRPEQLRWMIQQARSLTGL